MKIAELFADFKVKFSDTALRIANTALSELKLGTIAEAFAIDTLVRGFINLGSQAMSTSSHLHILSDAYGINTTWLQKMENAGFSYNVSAKQTEQTVVSLQRNLAAFRIGQGSSSFMQSAGFFGINLSQATSAKNLLEQLRSEVPEFIKKRGPLGKSEASLLLEGFGIPVEEIQRLIGDKVTKKGGASLPVLTQEQIRRMTTLNSDMNILSRNVHYLAYTSISNLTKTITALDATIGDINNLFTVIAHPEDSLKGLWGIIKGLSYNPSGASGSYINQGFLSEQAALSNFGIKPTSGGGAKPVTVNQKVSIAGAGNPTEVKKAVTEANKKMIATLARTSPFTK
jgi:hypothetical protein